MPRVTYRHSCNVVTTPSRLGFGGERVQAYADDPEYTEGSRRRRVTYADGSLGGWSGRAGPYADGPDFWSSVPSPFI
jgi:hypothetical protein